jgi:GNAT superfamily N-acetyltransferase
MPFDCGYPELNQYLRQYALKNDQLSIGKTFIALNEAQEVAGYLTISTAQIAADNLPDSVRAGLPRYPVPAFRIGKLAVDRRFQGSGAGRWILTQALQKSVEVSNSVGLFAVLVDAIDETAKGFYLKYGFIPFEAHPLTLFLPLATIKSAML